MSGEPVFRVGVLGRGTVGGAFKTLLEERADAIAPVTGLRPEVSGVLSRSEGDFDQILEGSDLIVELIGGLEPARDLGLGLKRIGTAERVDGGLSVRVHPAFLYAGHPLASVHGPYNAVTVESAAITEITMSGPGAGGPQTASAVLGDVISAMIPPACTPETTHSLPVVEDVESAFYVHMEVADRPGVLAQVAEVLGLQGASIRTLVQRGIGDDARLVMTIHPILESRFFAAMRLIGQLDFMRSPPRSIRVIEEEFV